jgi:hypothetical protein
MLNVVKIGGVPQSTQQLGTQFVKLQRLTLVESCNVRAYRLLEALRHRQRAHKSVQLAHERSRERECEKSASARECERL